MVSRLSSQSIKATNGFMDDNLRLELVKLAIADYPNSGLPTSNSTCLVLPILYTHWMLYTKPIPTGNSPLSSGRDNWLLFPRLVQSRGDFKESSCNDLSPSEFHY